MKTKASIGQKIWGLVKGNPIVVMMAIVSIIVGFTIPNFFLTLTPETSAAFSLPPIAYMYLPWVVLLYRK